MSCDDRPMIMAIRKGAMLYVDKKAANPNCYHTGSLHSIIMARPSRQSIRDDNRDS